MLYHKSASQPTANQPTPNAPNEPARPAFATMGQNCIFWCKNVRFWAKHPNFFGRDQNFWYPHIRKPPRHLVHIVFDQAWHHLGQKGQYCQYCHTKNSNFGPNLVLKEQNFWYQHIGEPTTHLNFFGSEPRFLSTGHITTWAGKAYICPIWPKMLIFGG